MHIIAATETQMHWFTFFRHRIDRIKVRVLRSELLRVQCIPVVVLPSLVCRVSVPIVHLVLLIANGNILGIHIGDIAVTHIVINRTAFAESQPQ